MWGDMCTNSRVWVKKENDKPIKIHCKSYGCEECGPIKVWKLKKALNKELSGWKTVRFWTFTSRPIFISPKAQYQMLSRAWNHFRTSLKRLLPEKYKNFKYIKVVERHKSGYYHFHAFTNIYIDWYFVQGLWNSSLLSAYKYLTNRKPAPGELSEFSDELLKLGHCNVRLVSSTSIAVRYIVKYISKQTNVIDEFRMNRYSKSMSIIFFAKVTKYNGKITTFKFIYKNNRLNLIIISKTQQHDYFEIMKDFKEFNFL